MSNGKPCVRVLEIRAAENGWVISGFERGQSVYGDDNTISPYFTMVAETPKRCTEIIGDLLKQDNWQKDVSIMPARKVRRVMG